jgi:YhcH/YjgK/YiaL family protein
MIIDKLANNKLYRNLHPRFQEAFDFLERSDLGELNSGRIDLKGEELFVLINSYTTKKNELNVLEAHKKYIDLQYVVQGTEGIDYEIYDNHAIHKEYDQKEDYILYKPKDSSTVKLDTNHFALLYPEDLHLPTVAFNDVPSEIKKIVIKILID